MDCPSDLVALVMSLVALAVPCVSLGIAVVIDRRLSRELAVLRDCENISTVYKALAR